MITKMIKKDDDKNEFKIESRTLQDSRGKLISRFKRSRFQKSRFKRSLT